MKRRFPVSRIFLAVLCITVMDVASSSAALAFKRTHVGDTVSDFTLESLDGAPVTLSESLGEKATVVAFWASWSPRSHLLLADLQKYYDQYGPEALKVVGVNVEHQEWKPEDAALIAQAATDAGVTFPMVLDKDLFFFEKYGVMAVPSAVLMNAEMKAVALLMGYGTMPKEQFKEDLQKALGVYQAPVVAHEKEGYQPKGKAERYVSMASMLAKKKRYNRALKSLEQAISEDPEYVEIYRLQATIYQEQEKPDDALAATKKADELQAAQGGAAPAEEAPVTDDPGVDKKPEAAPSTDATPAQPTGKGSALETASANKKGA